MFSGKNLPVAVLELVDCEGHLDDDEKYTKPLYVVYFFSVWKIEPAKSITYVVMFDRASNVRLAGGLLEIHYPLLDGMHGVEHNVSLF